MKILYNPKLKNLSRELRKNSTLSEVLLWKEIRGKKMKGYQFMRQKPIGKYIVDFYCSWLKLVIEIDGDTHTGKDKYDIKRQKYLESLGLKVMRFLDIEIKKNLQGVLIAINNWIETTPLPPFNKGE